MNVPSIPEDMKKVPKEQLDVVFASGPEGKVYAIPLAVAAEYESDDEHPAVIPPEGGSDEVGGRDARWLADGSYGYHSDWQYGNYIWIVGGLSCRGLHWHPNPYSPYAHDQDG